MNPKYPIFIPSKGRFDTRPTSRALDKLRVPYRIVVEPAEYERYARVIATPKILVLPDNFSEMGQGSIPARNWIFERAISEGHDRHWIIDDNIYTFYRLNRNQRIPVDSGTIFRCAEDFTDRYENVAFSGFNYAYFVKDRAATRVPFILNHRVYSMILVNNAITYRWRGRYNEDTDICLRALKAGWCTVLFNAFLGQKAATLTMKGGNTDTIYNTGDRRRAFAESLREQHPDCVEVTWKFGRWHHQVDYRPFERNKLVRKSSVDVRPGVDNYGMALARVAYADEPDEIAAPLPLPLDACRDDDQVQLALFDEITPEGNDPGPFPQSGGEGQDVIIPEAGARPPGPADPLGETTRDSLPVTGVMPGDPEHPPADFWLKVNGGARSAA